MMAKKRLPKVVAVSGLPPGFASLLEEVKSRIRAAQMRAVLGANAEMVRLYWDIGQRIHKRQQREGWGARPFRAWHGSCATSSLR